MLPAKAKIKKLKRSKRSITVKFVSQKKSGISGYQIACSKQNGAVKYAYAGKKATSKKVKKLSRRSIYNVKVRAYKKVGSTTIYGPWSDAKVKKTR